MVLYDQGPSNTAISDIQSDDEGDKNAYEGVHSDIDESYAQFLSLMGKITVRGTNTSN